MASETVVVRKPVQHEAIRGDEETWQVLRAGAEANERGRVGGLEERAAHLVGDVVEVTPAVSHETKAVPKTSVRVPPVALGVAKQRLWHAVSPTPHVEHICCVRFQGTQQGMQLWGSCLVALQAVADVAQEGKPLVVVPEENVLQTPLGGRTLLGTVDEHATHEVVCLRTPL